MKQKTLLNKENSLLLIVDLQEKLVLSIKKAKTVIKNVVKLIKVAKILNIPILLTEQKNLGKTVKEIKKEIDKINPILKIEFNCFNNKNFKKQISKIKKKQIILVGLEAHICILETALGAPQKYKIFVIEDAVSSRNLNDLKVAIERMRMKEIEILTAEMVIFELLKKAGTQEFKKILPLVKEKT
jgi:nicotinamidase-related amidase